MHSYDLKLVDGGWLLRADIRGHRSPLQSEMAHDGQACWDEMLSECQRLGLGRILVTSRLTGWVSTPAVYSTFEHLRRVWPVSVRKAAYVDLNPETAQHNQFGEKLSTAAGINIRVFTNASEAERWLAETDSP